MMKHFLILLLLPVAGHAAITWDGTAGKNFSASCTSLAASAINVPAGHNVRAYLRLSGTSTVVFSTAQGDTFTNLAVQSWNGGGAGDYFAYSNGVVGNAALVVTATFTGGSPTNCGLLVTSDSGAALSDPLYTGSTYTTGNPTSPAFSTAVANEIIYFACTGAATSSAMSASAPYATAVDDSAHFSFMEYQIVSTIQTSVTASMLSSNNVNHGCVVAAFEASVTSTVMKKKAIVF